MTAIPPLAATHLRCYIMLHPSCDCLPHGSSGIQWYGAVLTTLWPSICLHARLRELRSRRLEQGEKCTKYFFNLERRNHEISSLSKLKMNDAICEDEKWLSQYVGSFCEKLYLADPLNKDKMTLFLRTIQPASRRIDEVFQLTCDQKISRTEVQKCTDALKDNKAPGTDGLTGELNKCFSCSIFSWTVWRGSRKRATPHTLRQGLIKLIPKPKKRS